MLTIETDLPVIGGRAAECRAAIEAAHHPIHVLLVLKAIFGAGGCSIDLDSTVVEECAIKTE